MAIERSYINKIKDFGIDSGSFKNDNGETVAYRSLVIEVMIDGSIEKINLSGNSAPKPALLETILRSVQSENNTQTGNFLEQ